MIVHTYLIGLLAGLAAIVCGCAADQARPYASLQDTAQARRVADLVVNGEVTEALEAERLPVNTFAIDNLSAEPSIAASHNMDCIRKTRITMQVAEVVKAPSAVPDRVQFWFESPCYAADPDVLLGEQLPPTFTEGRLLRAYLVSRGGQYWLIAHEPWYRPVHAVVEEPRVYKLPGPEIFDVTPPEPAPPAGEEGTATVPPQTPAPATVIPVPATPGLPAASPASPTAPAYAPLPPPLRQTPPPVGAPNYNPRDRWWPPPK
jgi:hypothetical protein